MKSTALAIALTVSSCLALLAAPARADDLNPKTATQPYRTDVPIVMQVTYTGSPSLVFVLSSNDIKNGSKMLSNQGNLQWKSNMAPWAIKVKRSAWTKDGDSSFNKYIVLEVRKDSPGSTDWHIVPQILSYNWITSSARGSGQYNGLDWRVNYLDKIDGDDHDRGKGNDKLGPGTYRTTVTFTMTSN